MEPATNSKGQVKVSNNECECIKNQLLYHKNVNKRSYQAGSLGSSEGKPPQIVLADFSAIATFSGFTTAQDSGVLQKRFGDFSKQF